MPKTKKKPRVPLVGQNGNIFNLMLIVGRYLEKDEKDEMVRRITTESKSYGESLLILGEYVEIV